MTYFTGVYLLVWQMDNSFLNSTSLELFLYFFLIYHYGPWKREDINTGRYSSECPYLSLSFILWPLVLFYLSVALYYNFRTAPPKYFPNSCSNLPWPFSTSSTFYLITFHYEKYFALLPAFLSIFFHHCYYFTIFNLITNSEMH